ncbi:MULTISPECIES: hypothetical protein [Sphingomonas]|nr:MULTISPECIES: hypothetical protein [Sphingomonas]
MRGAVPASQPQGASAARRRAGDFPYADRNLCAPPALSTSKPVTGCRRADMKQIFPLVLAIVPLVAVLGACVAVP